MRRLIVFSDPGGAKPCLSLARKWKESDDVIVFSDRNYAFFETFGIPVHHCQSIDVPKIFERFHPNALFTGTSYTSSIELDFIREAANRGIFSASFVDHYTGFDVRFRTEAGPVLPDKIYVVDDKAAALALEAKLPEAKVRIVGNPYHEFLRCWRSRLTKEQCFREIGIPLSPKRTILFAPDPLSNAGGVPHFGTDEVNVLQLLLACLGELGASVQLLIKAHPNQSLEYLQTGLSNLPCDHEVHIITEKKDALLNDLIQHVDLVTGMFSNLLIEAELLGAVTLRILSEVNCADPLEGKSSGEVVRQKSELAAALRKHVI